MAPQSAHAPPIYAVGQQQQQQQQHTFPGGVVQPPQLQPVTAALGLGDQPAQRCLVRRDRHRVQPFLCPVTDPAFWIELPKRLRARHG